MKVINSIRKYNFLIVGASVAGASTAIFLAKKGYSVAIVDKAESTESYKLLCTHFLQPYATPIIRELGIEQSILNQDGKKNGLLLWTGENWMECKFPSKINHGYSIRRSKLDSILKNRLMETEGIDLFLGATLKTIEFDEGRARRAIFRTPADKTIEFSFDSLIGADGSHSLVTKLCKIDKRFYINQRFAQFAYFKNLDLVSETSAMGWLVNQGESQAYVIPQDNNYVVLSAYITKRKEQTWFEDNKNSFFSLFENLPGAPLLSDRQLRSKIMGCRNMRSFTTTPVSKNVALVGDAATTTDPMSGTGITLAMISAKILAECFDTNRSIDNRYLDKALNNYARQHFIRIQLIARVINTFSDGNPLSPLALSALNFSARFISPYNGPCGNPTATTRREI